METQNQTNIELSIVMPCLNEEETLGVCLQKAKKFLSDNSIDGEIIVADNGSSDNSKKITEDLGAILVEARPKGYGSALISGFERARGKFIIMGDSDDSYDFSEILPLLEELRCGADLVMGNRFKGKIEKNAMPVLHKYFGNPILTLLVRLFFKAPIGDVQCGLRGFKRSILGELKLRTLGMEFASEMVVKAAARKFKIKEVPVVLKKDGRSREPHLRSFSDGWRNLKFLLMLCPKWSMICPGVVLFTLGLLISGLEFSIGINFQKIELGIHSFVAGCMLIIVGFQAVAIGTATRIFVLQEEIGPPSQKVLDYFSVVTLGRSLAFGVFMTALGVGFILSLLMEWAARGFGSLESPLTVRLMIFAATLASLGFSTILMTLFYSVLKINKR